MKLSSNRMRTNIIFVWCILFGTVLAAIPVLCAIIMLVGIASCTLFGSMAFILKSRRHIYKKSVLRSIIPIIFILAGSIGLFVVAFFCESIIGPIPSSKFMLSLSNAEGIAVDNKSNIYVGCKTYSRIQVYDENGKFLKGWFAPLSKGRRRIEVVGNGDVFLKLSGRMWAYDPNGNLLFEKEYSQSKFDEEYGFSKNISAKDFQGNEYVIKYPILDPRVVKIAPSGEETVVIRDPFGFRITRQPFPGFLLFVVTLLLYTWLSPKLDRNFDKQKLMGQSSSYGYLYSSLKKTV